MSATDMPLLLDLSLFGPLRANTWRPKFGGEQRVQRNQRHLQRNLFGELNNLTSEARPDLECSWAGVFCRDFFCWLDERPFDLLYNAKASHPNTSINVLVGLEALKPDLGSTDAEMYDHFRCQEPAYAVHLSLRADRQC